MAYLDFRPLKTYIYKFVLLKIILNEQFLWAHNYRKSQLHWSFGCQCMWRL